MSEPRIVGHTELCLFLLPFLQQGNFTVEDLVSALLKDFQVIDRDIIPNPPPVQMRDKIKDVLREHDLDGAGPHYDYNLDAAAEEILRLRR